MSEKLKEYEDAKENLDRQTGCFRNVLRDRYKMGELEYESYCEEMQGALDREEATMDAWLRD